VNWRHRLKQTLLAGLIILAPLALTVFILVQVFQVMDGMFSPLVNSLLAAALDRPDLHLPGLGLLLTLLLILILGWLSRSRLIHWMERGIRRIPVAKSIYGATKGILEIISQDQTEAFKRVVLIEYPKKDIFAIAFVTSGARWGQVDDRLADVLLVFVPTTPNPTSGFLLLVPRTEAMDLPITVEEGVRMVISGGILLPTPRAGGLRGPGTPVSLVGSPPAAAAKMAADTGAATRRADETDGETATDPAPEPLSKTG
jgi:uncharacterized membrane protein